LFFLIIIIEILHEESEYRKKLKNNFPKFISIFEDYLIILDDLKKIKFRRENEEKENMNQTQTKKNKTLINNHNNNIKTNKKNDFLIKKENIHKRRLSADSIIKVNKFDFIEETSDIENKVLFTTENELDNIQENINTNNNNNKNYGAFNSLKSKKKYSNLIKSISNKKSTLQNNLTFNNYNILLSNRITFSNNDNNSNRNNNHNNSDTLFCPSCNKTFKFNNIINSTKSFKENNTGNQIPPFKLYNNNFNEKITTETEEREREYFHNGNKSPEGEKIKKKFSPIQDGKKIELDNKNFNFNLLSFNTNNLKQITPEKEFDINANNNINKNSINDNRKFTLGDLSNMNSFANTPNNIEGLKTFNLNNSNLQGSSVKGKLENFRGSYISMYSNKKNYYNYNNEENNSNYLNELLLIKKEYNLYKNCFDSLTNEYKNFKLFEKNKEQAILKFYEENEIIFEKEVNCFWKALKVYKEIFTDSINIKENKIFEMSKVFDEIVKGENTNFFNQGINNTINNTNSSKKKFY
jgi:hypothetical protein